MKKIKWILLAITIALLCLFLFATCKKTKAYTNDFENPFEEYSFVFGSQESTQGFCFLIYTDQRSFTLFTIKRNNNRLLTVWLDNNYLAVYDQNTSTYLRAENIHISTKNYLYFQFLFDYDENKTYLYYSTLSPHIVNRQDESPIIDYYFLDYPLSNNSSYIELPANINSLYLDRLTPLTFSFINESTSYNNYGLMQLYTFNIEDNFSQEKDEQVEFLFDDVKNDIPKNLNNNLIDTYYTQGYNAGYQLGYNRGYSEGYSLGTNEGYAAGYQAGQEDTQLYQNGYNAGYTRGYSDGEMSTDAYSLGYDTGYDEGLQNGYRNGYNTGYNAGYLDGEEGNTVFTPAFNTISAVFGAVGSVMSINLFPGIPLGLFFLVPLFFSAIGLILWIWRRN